MHRGSRNVPLLLRRQARKIQDDRAIPAPGAGYQCGLDPPPDFIKLLWGHGSIRKGSRRAKLRSLRTALAAPIRQRWQHVPTLTSIGLPWQARLPLPLGCQTRPPLESGADEFAPPACLSAKPIMTSVHLVGWA
jgi:hypothetical protein